MTGRTPGTRGYSLIELLTVLIIVGILAVVGVLYLGSRPAAGVRGVLDELEGALLDAQKQAVASGRDLTLATKGGFTGGVWDPANPMVIVRGDSTILAGDWTAALNAAQGIWPPAQGGMTAAQFTTLAQEFRLATSNGVLSREHMHASVAQNLATFNGAVGTSDNINTVAPFATSGAGKIAGFSGNLTDATLLFTGGEATGMSISGTNKRFNQTFWIPVVSIRSGLVVPGGPMGLVFVQANGGTVYKFYNPGTQSGDGKWRRI